MTQLRIAQLANFIGPTSGGLKVAVEQLGRGYVAAGAERLLVIHDELDLPPESLRLKFGGGEGGHNGLRSISAALGTRDYLRLRVGIGRPPGRMDPASFVLKPFTRQEAAELPFICSDAADELEKHF